MNRNSCPPAGHRAPPAAGFQLFELVVLVALLAGAVALAVPGYARSAARARRADAIDALVATAQQVERYYARCNAYPADLAALAGGTGALPCRAAEGRAAVLAAPLPSALGYYALRLQVPNPVAPLAPGGSSYLLTAVPVGPQRTDACGTFRYDELGQTGNDGPAAGDGDCWRR